MPGTSAEKICRLCGEDCSNKPRIKDRQGHYYCRDCHAAAAARLKKQHEEAASPASVPADQSYALVEDAPPIRTASGVSSDAPTGPSTPCPSCDRPLPAGTQICVACGINIETGRSIVMSRGVDENMVHYNAERVLRPFSWLIWVGYSPVASEAMGHRKPYVTWVILALTCIVTVWFWFSTDVEMQSRKNLMLWGGNESPTPDYIIEFYENTNLGDFRAFNNKLRENRANDVRSGEAAQLHRGDFQAVYMALTPDQRVLGEFRFTQVFTHTLLHGGLLHLAGNMVFLIIFGSRINALIGNIAAAILYPFLGALAAWAQMMSMSGEMPMPMLGASGAIMGLAGMYFIFFPLNRMHMSIWFRFFFFFRMKVWAMRGFWVVLFYIAWDILYVSIGSEDNIAHWAHLGGFIAGMVLAFALLLSRMFYAGGTDLLSVLLGKHVWVLTGRPSEHKTTGFSMPKM